MLVDTIKQDLPEDLMALYNAILQVATTIVAHREVAKKLNWLHENAKHKEDNYKQFSKNKGKKRKYSDDKQNKNKDENPKKKTTEEKDSSSSSSSSAPPSGYKGKNPKPKCNLCQGHHDKDTICPAKKNQHNWNKGNKKPQKGNTEGTNDDESLYNEMLIDTDIISYIIPSTLPPVSAQVNTTCTDSVNINITTSDIDLLHNIFDDTKKNLHQAPYLSL